jgi:hypothetical protein
MQAMMATQMNDMVRAFEIAYLFVRSSSQGTPARHGRTWQVLERGGKLEQHSIIHVKECIVNQVANRKYVMAHAALFDHVARASFRLNTPAFQARHLSQS